MGQTPDKELQDELPDDCASLHIAIHHTYMMRVGQCFTPENEIRTIIGPKDEVLRDFRALKSDLPEFLKKRYGLIGATLTYAILRFHEDKKIVIQRI